MCVVLSSQFCKFLLIYEVMFGTVMLKYLEQFFLANLHWLFIEVRTVQQPMLLDFRDGIRFVLLLIYVAEARFSRQVHALLTGLRLSHIQKIETLQQIVCVSSHTIIHASWLFGFLSMF
jgi:hypothetical protein